MSWKKLIPFLVALLCVSAPAQAYIGPGAGAGTIAVVLGILAALAMALISLVYFPVRRMLRKRKAGSRNDAKDA